MTHPFPTLRERLITRGIPAEEVPTHLFRLVFTWPQRAWWTLRLLLGGDPFMAEHEFVADIAGARTWADLEMALRDYRHAPAELRTLFMRPRTRRLRAFARRLNVPRA